MGLIGINLLLSSVAAVAACAAQESPSALIEGAVAERDYVAPVDVVVVDVPATVARAASAGARLPLVVRRDPRAAEAAVAGLDAAFRATRTAFLAALEGAFGSRKLDGPTIDSARFRSFRSEFQADNTGFPVSLGLAQTWAEGEDGEPVRTRLVAVLRSTMTGRLIGDLRPASTVFVAALDADDRIRTWSEASSHARAVEPGTISDLDAAGQAMRHSLDVLDRGVGGFMAGLLQPNVIADDYLTGLLLLERFADQVQTRAYRSGELIIRARSRFDREGLLAVTQLARMGWGPDPALPEAEIASHSGDAAPGANLAATLDAHAERRWRSVVAGICVVALALGGLALVWRVRQVRKLRGSAPWLDQPKIAAVGHVREALLPHLARELKQRLVHALFAQRQELLYNEAAATERVADLEERLAKLQPAIAERIRMYEQRIQALEAEIVEKDQETRDLLRAKLVLARKELDAEIQRQHIDWN